MSTNISLSTNKQGLSCEGNLKKNACGQRGLPTRGMQTSTIFLRSVNFDPEGLDHWQCSPSNELHTSYTLKGTYYNAYVKMSNCDIPFGQYELLSRVRLKSIVCHRSGCMSRT